VSIVADRELARSPRMSLLFARAGVSALPGASWLPFLGGRGSALQSGAALTLDGARVDRERLAAYDRVCGFALRDILPATYPHMLAFPLHLALITDSSFPFPAVGLLHISNRIVVHRPIDAGEALALRVWCEPGDPHPRGTAFAILTQARVGEELVWEEQSINLHRGGGAPDAEPPTVVPSSEDLPAAATWRLRGDLGRRYGAVSGDLNPIHVHPLTARLFGFRSAIAHGMWTKARCLAALGPQLPDAYTVEVAFKRPLALPGTVQFAEARSGSGLIGFGVRDARTGMRHLDGLVTL
jgi:acyl dehydratase